MNSATRPLLATPLHSRNLTMNETHPTPHGVLPHRHDVLKDVTQIVAEQMGFVDEQHRLYLLASEFGDVSGDGVDDGGCGCLRL